MKRLFYILSSLLLLTACSEEFIVPNEVSNVKEGDKVTVQFSINAPEQDVAETRTLGDFGETGVTAQEDLNLWLFVFDSNGIFLQAAEATPGSSSVEHENHQDTPFAVTLNATSSQRIIHFIAFDDSEGDTGLANQIASSMNKFGTESSKIAEELYTTAGQAAYWQRVVVNGITKVENTDQYELKGLEGCVPLVRNFAKISVEPKNDIENFVYEGFAITGAPSKGTIAPFNAGFVEYVDGKVQKSYESLTSLGYNGLTPSGATYSTPTADDISTNPQYLYETPNATGNVKGRTAIVVKGRYNNNPSSYYKVDLIYNSTDEAAGNLFYNILRNIEYKVIINEVTGNGHSSLEAALSSAASNNLSASTATSNLSRISDGEQMIEVTSPYFCFTENGVETVLKYRYRYSDNGGTNWITDNSLIVVKNSNDALFNSWSVADADDTTGDYAEWRTITLDLKSPSAQTQTSYLHIYASRSAIDGSSSIPATLKESILSGELLYRDVRVDLRNPYTLVVDAPSYVPSGVGEVVRVNLLIPQGINEALFPMDFYLEDADKKIYPDASNSIKLPVHVGTSIVEGAGDASFQYTRTVTKADYASLETKTVNGVTYKVVPCYFKTSVESSATTIYASNEYFSLGSDTYLNIPVAFTDDTYLTIDSEKKEYFGRGYPVTLTFNVTPEAVTEGTEFMINVTEGGETYSYTYTPTASGEVNYTYYTQSMNGEEVTATITAIYSAERGAETKSSSMTMSRRYFVIGKESFTNNVSQYSRESSKEDGSLIYIDGTYVGWFGRQWNNVPGHYPSEGFINDNGPKDDYVIDRSFQNYATLTDATVVRFAVNDHETAYVETTIEALDNAAINVDATRLHSSAAPLVLTFSEH